ncbi:hypothetical protein CIPAW_02G190400 [Carya illinoinensis]|uniref:Uncharacterized protein n=1 Tax=Carya illinoinensis TaxID=32201 RepID=A0A8T1RJ43_CARIL|nr:hypothetical protein CIPAW_02G190400 [Carya illinoinensis]
MPPVRLFTAIRRYSSFSKEPSPTGIFPVSLFLRKLMTLSSEQWVKLLGITPTKELLARMSCCSRNKRVTCSGISPDKKLSWRLMSLRKLRLPMKDDMEPRKA